jgi:hypothetical protein
LLRFRPEDLDQLLDAGRVEPETAGFLLVQRKPDRPAGRAGAWGTQPEGS